MCNLNKGGSMHIWLTGKEEELCEELRKELEYKYSKAVVIRALLKLRESLNKKSKKKGKYE
jgi:hypothetical protein